MSRSGTFLLRSRAGLARLWVVLLVAGGPLHPIGEGGTKEVFEQANGARALALGNSHVALARGAGGLLWNAAALDTADRAEWEANFSLLSLGGWMTQTAFAVPLVGAGTLGVGLGTLFSDAIESYSDEFVKGAPYSYLRLRASVGYGQKLGPLPVQVGASVRMDYYRLSAVETAYFNLDAGLRVSFLEFGRRTNVAAPSDEWILGFTARNLFSFSGPNLGTVADIEPIAFTTGTSYHHRFSRHFRLGATVDGSLDLQSNVGLGFGIEASFVEHADLRFGYQFGQGFGLGAGLRFWDLDFAYALLSRAGEWNHAISAKWTLGDSRERRLRVAEDERRRVVDEAVRKAVEEEKARVEGIRLALQRKSDELLLAAREESERKIRTLALENERTVAAFEASNRVLLEVGVRANETRWRSILASNEAALAASMESNRAGREALEASNRIEIQQWSNRTAEVARQREREIEVIRARQRTLDGLYAGALSAFQNGNTARAMEQFDKILEMDPGNAEILQLVRIVKDARRPVEDYSADENEMYREGVKWYLAKDYPKAIAAWEALLRKYPSNHLAAQGLERARKRLKGNER